MPDLTAQLYTADGKRTGDVDLNPDIFGIEPNPDVMHQVVTAQLAGARAGTHSTKTRAEVRGGGRKPWRQKGLGRARHGSIRSPLWTGGGVAHGPKPRDYSQRTPKKMKRLALRSALSTRAADGQIKVVETFDDWDTPKTKNATALLEAMGVSGKVLLLAEDHERVAIKSFRNIEGVIASNLGQANTYDVLWAETVIMSRGTLELGQSVPRGTEEHAEKREESRVESPEQEVSPTEEGVATESLPDTLPREDAVADEAMAESAKETEPQEAQEGAWRGEGEPPKGFDIKGNEDSMLYHTPDSWMYEQTEAEVWFNSEEAAVAAGFTRTSTHPDDDSELETRDSRLATDDSERSEEESS
jgi:large subunit ribosomal protein L4